MSNIYRILQLSTRIKSRRLKLLGLWGFHILGKRYIGIFLDPVLGCNFRCKMCYFSNEEERKKNRGILRYEEMEQIADSLFHRALKLQIGCGAEPTLHKDLVKIIALGKQKKVPYISLTTNGNLLTKDILTAAIENGLNELTLSTHGFTKQTYEYLMTNGNFELFCQLLSDIADLKRKFPKFKLRINYTINNDNLDELKDIWKVVGSELDILQLRPIQHIGKCEYTDFDLSTIYAKYDEILLPLIKECHSKNIICLIPKKQNIISLKEHETSDNSIEQATYCYVSPRECWQENFDFKADTFESYSAQHHIGRSLMKKIFAKTNHQKAEVTRKLNYNIK